MQTLKNDLDIIRKKAKIKKGRKPYPKMKSKSTGKWIYFKSPSVVYFGGALHWVGKDGKIKHSYNKTVEEAAKEVMNKMNLKNDFIILK